MTAQHDDAAARIRDAAPDLLAAVEALIAYDNSASSDDDGVAVMFDYANAIYLARAAIAKARGQA